MAQRTFGLVGILLVVVLAFVSGYWTEHRNFLRSKADLQTADKMLADARARQRLFHLEISLLNALERAAAKDYKEAESRATDFFIEVQTEIARPDMAKYKGELQQILSRAEEVRRALEKQDPVVRDLLRGMMLQLARVVEPPTPSEPPALLPGATAPQS